MPYPVAEISLSQYVTFVLDAGRWTRCAARSCGRRFPRWSAGARAIGVTPRQWSTASGVSPSRRCNAWSTMPPQALIGALGIEHGDRVAVWAPNSPESIVATLGIAAGGVLVPINTRFRGGADLVVTSHASGARTALHRPQLPRHRLSGTARGRRRGAPRTRASRPSSRGDAPDATTAWDDFVAAGRSVTDADLDSASLDRPRRPRATSCSASKPAGLPKGVVMTHGQTLRAYLDWCDWADLRPGDRYLIANPFFHIFGYKAGCPRASHAGCDSSTSWPCSTRC